MAAEMAIGMSLAQQMMQQTGGILGNQKTTSGSQPAGTIPPVIGAASPEAGGTFDLLGTR